jgi:hypothetical protein
MTPEQAVCQSLTRLAGQDSTPDDIKALIEEILLDNTPEDALVELRNQAQAMIGAGRDLRPCSGRPADRVELDLNNRTALWQYINRANR